jgi:hypothetical protein
MSMWYDLLAIMKDVTLGEDEDHIMWCFSSNGKYSVQTLYAVINHRGIVPMFFMLYGCLRYLLGYKFFRG